MILTSKDQNTDPPIVCNLTAIPAEQQEQHKTTAEQIFLAVEETHELPDGYAFRLPETSEMLLKAAEFVSNEPKLYPNNIDQEVTQMVIKDQVKENELALFCDMTALKPEERKQHQLTTEQLFGAITQIEALPNGYAFPLPEEPEVLSTAAEFIKYERLCCPFLSFALEVEPQGEPFRLKLTGPEGVKQFLLFELNLENKLIV